MVMSMKTYYELLGVPQDAGIAEIKRAYREKLLKYHPDKSGRPDHRIAVFQEAYQILSRDASRKEYDRTVDDARRKLGMDNDGSGLDIYSLDEFSIIEEADQDLYVKDCPRCHAIESFRLTEDDLEQGGEQECEIIAQCASCSLWLRVQYSIV